MNVKNILKNVQNEITERLGKNYFCFFPLIFNIKNKISLKVPILVKREKTIENVYLYDIDIENGEIKERSNSYITNEFEKECLDNIDIFSECYEAAYNILNRFVEAKSVDRFLYIRYYEILSYYIPNSVNAIFRTLLEDKEIKDNIFTDIQDFDRNVDINLLNRIPDDMLSFALWVNSNSKVHLSKDDKGRITLTSRVVELCDIDNKENKGTYEIEDLIKAIRKNDGILKNGKEIISDKWQKINVSFIEVCDTCYYSRCPSFVIAYVGYLKGKGLLEAKLQDREIYEKGSVSNNFFDFIWEIENGVKNVSQNIFEGAEYLARNNLVNVGRNLKENLYVKINFAYACNELWKYVNKESLANMEKKSNSNWEHLKRNSRQGFELCSAPNCCQSECIVGVAGYIYYLIKSGQSEKIAEDRKYYKEHENKFLLDTLKYNQVRVQKLKEEKYGRLSDAGGPVPTYDLDNIIDRLEEENKKITKFLKIFDAEKEVNNIVEFIRKYYKENNLGGVVIGISGGKDSAVVSALFTEALGSENVIGVTIPCYSNPDDFEDARLISNHYGFELINFDITGVFDSFKSEVNKLGDFGLEELKNSDINIKPRLRMTTLYYLAALYSKIKGKTYLVAGTSNKSELFVGYFTKGGDSVSDISPIADFTVEEVIKIGEYLKVPEKVLYKTPSDGLSSQTDEEKLGVKYSDISLYIEDKKELNKSIQEKIEKLHKNSQHKFNIPTYRRKE